MGVFFVLSCVGVFFGILMMIFFWWVIGGYSGEGKVVSERMIFIIFNLCFVGEKGGDW